MEIAGFEFLVDAVDGCRLIEGIYPPVVDVSRLSAVISAYYDLWDEDVPTVSLQNLTRLATITPDVKAILQSVIQRTILQPSFIASAWYVGDNAVVREQIAGLLRDLGRSSPVCTTRDEALDQLREAIASRE